MLYRLIRPVAFGEEIIPAGAILPERRFSRRGLEVLTRRGTIAPVAAPPLGGLPGWTHRAKRLEPLGLTDAAQVIEASPERIAAELGVSLSLARSWQTALLTWLQAPARKRG